MSSSFGPGPPDSVIAPILAPSRFLRGGWKRINFGPDSPDRKSLSKLHTFAPEASWLLGSLLLFFGVFGAGSDTARKAFLGGLPPLGAVFMWFLVWSLVAGISFLGFALLSRTQAKSLSNWVLTLLIFIVLNFLLQISGISSNPSLFFYRDFLRIPWTSPVFGMLLSLVGAAAMFVGFQLYRLLLKKALAFKPFSVSVATFLLGGYFGILSFFLPESVNYSFTATLWPILWGTAFLLFSGVGILGKSPFASRPKRKVGSPWPIQGSVLAFIPLIPIFRYLATNLDLFSIGDTAILLAVSAVLATVAIVVVPAFMAPVVDRKIHSVTATAGLYVLYNMASLSETRAWYETGNLVEQAAFLIFVFLVLAIFSSLRSSVFALIVVAILVLEVTLSLGANTPGEEVPAEEADLSQDFNWVETATGKPWLATPDVYLLVFESYANEETMNSYGIDNSEQIDGLMDSGFTIYDGTYSVSAWSLASMSRVLEMSSTIIFDPRAVTSGASTVNRVFQDSGYDTRGVFPNDYFLRGSSPTYSSFFPPAAGFAQTGSSLTSSVFRGEFRFEDSYVEVDYQQYLKEKRKVLGLDSRDPIFLHTHSSFPGHSQNSGTCRPVEVENYAQGLREANREMTADIGAIPNLDDAIVIISGDHGPYLTKNCSGLGTFPSEEISRLDIQDRYGTFLAIRWPEEIPANSRIEVLQDIFPAVFSTLTRSESLFEEARISGTTRGSSAGPVRVENGVILGGQDDGQPLFLNRNRRSIDQ